jgi:hypothetical protein
VTERLSFDAVLALIYADGNRLTRRAQSPDSAGFSAALPNLPIAARRFYAFAASDAGTANALSRYWLSR